jgi:leader peptidase (prepilin peptidase)/N-methyltransferase
VPSLHGQGDGVFIVGALQSGLISIKGLLIGSGLVLWIALIAETLLRKEAMGFGDVKFVGAIGAFTGWQGAMFSVFGGAVIGTLWIGLALLWRKLFGDRVQVAPRAETPEGGPAEIGLGVQIPFGPMLAVAGLLYFFGLDDWLNGYFAELAAILQ